MLNIPSLSIKFPHSGWRTRSHLSVVALVVFTLVISGFGGSKTIIEHEPPAAIDTIGKNGSSVRPYHATVPSFGIWGFALVRKASVDDARAPAALPEGLRFLDAASAEAMFLMPTDLGPVPVETNRLDNQVLVRYYDADWKKWY